MLKIIADKGTKDAGFIFDIAEAKTFGRPIGDIDYNLTQAKRMGLVEYVSAGRNLSVRLTARGRTFLHPR